MFNNFDNEVSKVLKCSENEMKRLKHPYVGSEHLLLAIIKSNNEVVKILNKYNIDYTFENKLLKIVGSSTKESEYVLHTPLYKRIIDNAITLANDDKTKVSIRHLLLSLLDEGEGIAIRILLDDNVDLDSLYDELNINTNKDLKKYGRILETTTPIIGRDNEINSLIKSLLKKDKCNPILIGNAGVGKTAIVEELSRRINNNLVPDKLKDYKIISIEMGSLISGTKYRGEFEEKLTNIINNAIKNKIILFIDEIHTIANAGGADGAINAADILKPYLSRGNIKLIGATTETEYNNSILKDKALNRRFDIINILETDYYATKNILLNIKNKYEEFHNIKITDNNIEDILSLSNKYIHNKYNPDKSIEILDLVCSYVNCNNNYNLLNNTINNKKECIKKNDYKQAMKYLNEELIIKSNNNIITKSNILEVIGNKTNMDLITDREILLSNTITCLSNELIKQYEAINRLLVNIKYKLYNEETLLSILLKGNNGIGKTTTAKIIAKELNRHYIEIDMNDYTYESSIYKLIGNNKNKYIFQEINLYPSSVILIKNIDVAHYSIYKLFTNILENGFIKDINNDNVIFKNSILIFTEDTISSLGFNKKNENNLNVDDIIYYNDINIDCIKEYVDKYNVINNKNIDYEYIINNANYKKYGYKDIIKYINKYERLNLIKAL